MEKEVKFYVIKKGMFSNKLYIEFPSIYKLLPTTTSNILNAKWYEKYEEAEKIAKELNGEVEAYKLVPLDSGEKDEEIEVLKAANRQLRTERDNAIKLLKERKENICQKH